MNLKKGSILYVRIDYKIQDKEMTNQDFQYHLTYVKNTAKERYLLGGGFGNIDGGMILFEAENLEEAQKVAHSDPLIERGIYRCDVYKWELAVLSNDIEER